MPQFCQFLGVNSVTNIEPATGFMPVLISKFADWLENFSTVAPKYAWRPRALGAKGFSGAHPIAIWPFALNFKISGKLPIYEVGATYGLLFRRVNQAVAAIGEGDERRGSAQYRVEFDTAPNDDCQYPQAAKHAGDDEGDGLCVLRHYVQAEAGSGQGQCQKQPGRLGHGILR